MTDENHRVEIKLTQHNRDYWINKPYVDEKVKDELLKADILLVPSEGYKNTSDPVFPVNTEGFLRFVREHLPKDSLSVDIAISNDQYKELALHSGVLITIATAIATVGLAPLVVNIVTEYIKPRFNSGHKKTTIRFKLIEENQTTKQNRMISYEGPPETFESMMKEALRSTESTTVTQTTQPNNNKVLAIEKPPPKQLPPPKKTSKKRATK